VLCGSSGKILMGRFGLIKIGESKAATASIQSAGMGFSSSRSSSVSIFSGEEGGVKIRISFNSSSTRFENSFSSSKVNCSCSCVSLNDRVFTLVIPAILSKVFCTMVGLSVNKLVCMDDVMLLGILGRRFGGGVFVADSVTSIMVETDEDELLREFGSKFSCVVNM